MTAWIFDLDGTLVDSLDDIAHAMNEALSARGMPTHARDAYRRFIGDGVAELAVRALPPSEGTHAPRLASEFRAIYGEHLLVRTRPYAGVLEMLATLDGPMSVLSNKPDPLTHRIVEALLPPARFTTVRGHREPAPRKPDPTVALELAGEMGTIPAACVFVGDTATDMQTAVAAGMMGVGVLWGFRGREELVRAGARHIIAAPAELPSLLASLR